MKSIGSPRKLLAGLMRRRRVVAEAGDDGIEAFPSGGEIDNHGEDGDELVEKEMHAPRGASR